MSDEGDCAPTTLSRTDSVGLAAVAEAGILSASSLVILVILIIRNVIRYKKYATYYKWSLVEKPADVYVLSLFVADVLQSIGASMSARWVHDGTVTVGHYCTSQGLIQEFGETSVGLATMCIAIHTFVSIWMRKQHRVRTALIIVSIQWSFMALFVCIAAAKHDNYIEPSPFWCWVGPGYKEERLFGEYFWLWMTLLVSIAVYFPLFLWNQGYISIDDRHWWKVTWHWRAAGQLNRARERPVSSSLKLLAYPVAYSIVVLPVSVVRWITFSEQGCGRSSVPSAATFSVTFLHNCFGFVNVVLLLTTRPLLLLFDDPRIPKQQRLRCAAGAALVDSGSNWEARVSGDVSTKGRSYSAQSRRAASLDSSRDALGILLKEEGREKGNGVDITSFSPPSSDIQTWRIRTSATIRDESSGAQHVLVRQNTHSKSSSFGSGYGKGDIEANERLTEEITDRLEQMVSSQEKTSSDAQTSSPC